MSEGETTMNRMTTSILLAGALLMAALILVSGSTSGTLVNLAGFLFVVGGTLLTAIISQGYDAVTAMLRRIPGIFKPASPTLDDDHELFLRVAHYHRRGNARMADLAIKGFQDDFLRHGAQLITDRCSRNDLIRAQQWRIANAKESDKQKLRVLHSMMGFAPAFGMLGTLLGLLNMLFGLGKSGLDEVGVAMGFAMITTVYGLALANLVIKPVLIKMEQQSRVHMAWLLVKHEALMMLQEKQHPTLIQESLAAFDSSLEHQPTFTQRPAPVALVRAA